MNFRFLAVISFVCASVFCIGGALRCDVVVRANTVEIGDSKTKFELLCCRSEELNSKESPNFIFQTTVTHSDGRLVFEEWYLKESDIDAMKKEIDEVIAFDKRARQEDVEVEEKTFESISTPGCRVMSEAVPGGAFDMIATTFNFTYSNASNFHNSNLFFQGLKPDGNMGTYVATFFGSDLKKFRTLFRPEIVRKSLEKYNALR